MLVVEDEALVSLLLTDLLTRAGFEVRTCTTASEVHTLVTEFDPDVALLDINLGGGPSGLDVGHILHRTSPHIGLVFLTKFMDPRLRRDRPIPPGSAFLDKKAITDANALLDAIETVLHEDAPPPRHDARSPGGLDVLTRTQLETLRLAALGWTNSAIARQRQTNERAVEKRLRAVYLALGISVTSDVNPRVEAIRRYIAEAGMPEFAESEMPGAAVATAPGEVAVGEAAPGEAAVGEAAVDATPVGEAQAAAEASAAGATPPRWVP